MKTLMIAIAVVLVTSNALAMPPMPRSSSGVTRTDLQRHDLSELGIEALLAKSDIAPGITAL